MGNPNSARITDAMWRLWTEFEKAEDDVVLGGIYANKSGYHNTRAALPSSDYSVQATIDRKGPSDKAAAIDLTFNTARQSDFRVIAKYSKRLMSAAKTYDPRLYAGSQGIIREFFGNTDLDRDVEGWSLYRKRSATSDSSHLWHIHISVHRAYVNDWSRLSGVLDVLLDRSDFYAFPGGKYFTVGKESELIARANMRLRTKGLKAPASDKWTAGSKAAYRQWQIKLGYSGDDADGIPGEVSWNRLRVRKDGPLPVDPNPVERPEPQEPDDIVDPSTEEVVVSGIAAQLVRVKGKPAIYAVTLAGAAHIKNPTHLKFLRDAGMVTEDEREITQEQLDELLEKE